MAVPLPVFPGLLWAGDVPHTGTSAARTSSSELTLSCARPRSTPGLAITFLKHFQKRKKFVKKLGDVYKVVLNLSPFLGWQAA